MNRDVLAFIDSRIIILNASVAPRVARRRIDICGICDETERCRAGFSNKSRSKRRRYSLLAHGLTERGRKIVVELTINGQTINGSRAELSWPARDYRAEPIMA